MPSTGELFLGTCSGRNPVSKEKNNQKHQKLQNKHKQANPVSNPVLNPVLIFLEGCRVVRFRFRSQSLLPRPKSHSLPLILL